MRRAGWSPRKSWSAWRWTSIRATRRFPAGPAAPTRRWRSMATSFRAAAGRRSSRSWSGWAERSSTTSWRTPSLPRSASTATALRRAGSRCRARLQLDLVHRLLHRLEGLLEHGLLVGGELDLQDLLHPAGPDRHRHAHVVAVDPVLALQQGGAGKHALLVAQVALGHGHGAGGGGIEGGAGLEQRDDLAAALAGAVDDRAQALLGEEPLQRDAAHRAHPGA